MSSFFDSQVQELRKQVPFASINFQSFMRDAIEAGGWEAKDKNYYEHAFELTGVYRPDVASRMWFTLKFTASDGQRHIVEAQDFSLLLWRAVQVEINARDEVARREEGEGAS